MLEKIKRIKPQYIIITIFILIIIVALIINFTKSYSYPDEYLNDQTIDNVSFINANLNVKDNESSFKVEVINLSNDMKIKNIDVNFYDKDNNLIASLFGYIGEDLVKDKKYLLNAKIDNSIIGIDRIEYVINK